MAGLALFAILLLALLPTLGRLAQASTAVGDAAPSWAALCTARGLESIRLPAAPHGSAGDCDYCPLLATTIPVAVAMPSVPPSPPAPALCTSRTLPVRAQPHPCGLGSRGPPALS